MTLSPAGLSGMKCVAAESGREESRGLGPAVLDTVASQTLDCCEVFVLNAVVLLAHFVGLFLSLILFSEYL